MTARSLPDPPYDPRTGAPRNASLSTRRWIGSPRNANADQERPGQGIGAHSHPELAALLEEEVRGPVRQRRQLMRFHKPLHVPTRLLPIKPPNHRAQAFDAPGVVRFRGLPLPGPVLVQRGREQSMVDRCSAGRVPDLAAGACPRNRPSRTPAGPAPLPTNGHQSRLRSQTPAVPIEPGPGTERAGRPDRAPRARNPCPRKTG